jgi:hypothetical protein
MPIHLSWTPPVQQGSGIVGYKIYKTLYPGPLVKASHFLTVVGGNTLEYNDYAYTRRLLQDVGYIYKVTALTSEVESSFNDADQVHITYSFEDLRGFEDWDSG